ncbi:putative nucleotidyltransferase [Synechococcus sp. PCC 7502]|uniref:type VII toxin-antitoxin system MntA family adenylyltransferase antitoxin n=1 Tax=Synechococcus sp. PCC 7502 TaxID=1173263 RepID=UPI00029FEA9F|nr:nucleotidyltransferase domain-containing protein [Synechococcus sp. PCC 7502]AFY75033.1 putative nucleotidyltransferase [Synechococcus sp. PCC 7502]
MKTELSLADLQQRALTIGDRLPYLKFLVLFGSRARGDAYERSDWDFAILCDEEARQKAIEDQPYGFLAVHNAIKDCFEIGGECMDVVDVTRCSTLIAHYIAKEGVVLYESEIGVFRDFQQKVMMTQQAIAELSASLRQQVEAFLQEQGV